MREWLLGEGADFGEPDEQTVSFSVPFDLSELLAFKPAILFPFDGGRLLTTEQSGVPRVGVRFSTKRLCAIVGLFAAVLGMIGAGGGGLLLALGFALTVWLLVFGFHYVMGVARMGERLAELASADREVRDAQAEADGSSG